MLSTFPPVCQTERRAAIIEQVELHIAPAADQLLAPVRLRPGLGMRLATMAG
jgi:hypothetical protein